MTFFLTYLNADGEIASTDGILVPALFFFFCITVLKSLLVPILDS